jgi:hypothetical protein
MRLGEPKEYMGSPTTPVLIDVNAALQYTKDNGYEDVAALFEGTDLGLAT